MNIKGYKVNFLGDSITEGVGVTDRENCRYDNRVKKMLGLAGVNNYGIGGTRLAHQIHASSKPRHDLCFSHMSSWYATIFIRKHPSSSITVPPNSWMPSL